MTQENLDTQKRQFSLITVSGGKVIGRSPGGKIIEVDANKVAGNLLQKFSDDESKNLTPALNDAAVLLGQQLAVDSDHSAYDALHLLRAGIAVARILNPNYDAPERTMDEKLKDANTVIQTLVQAERSGAEIAQSQAVQVVARKAAGYLDANLFQALFNGATNPQVKRVAEHTAYLALTSIAGHIDSDVIKRGADNLRIVVEATANAREANARARVVTNQDRLKLATQRAQLAKEQVLSRINNFLALRQGQIVNEDLRARKALERVQSQQNLDAKLDADAARLGNQLTKERREQSVAIAERVLGGAVKGVKDFFVDPDKGIIVKGGESLGKVVGGAWDGLKDNLTTPVVAGIAGGSAVGLTTGLFAGAKLVEFAHSVRLTTAIDQPLLVVVPLILTTALAALGGSIGNKYSSNNP